MSGNGTNFIAFACGMKRSGKSRLLDTLATRFPRRILFDFVGEYEGKVPNATYGYTLAECVDALQTARKSSKWTVVCVMDPAHVPQLLGAIMDQRNPFTRAVGGVVLQFGEVDLVAPNNMGIATEVRNVFQRGRHFDVSALAATQRPRDVHRVVTSQSDVICAFRQHEPRDAEYLGSVTRSDAVPLLNTLQQYEYLRYYPNFGRLEVVDRNGTAREAA